MYKFKKKKLSIFKDNVPYHHPEFIYELLSIAKYPLVEYIFYQMINSIMQKGYVLLYIYSHITIFILGFFKIHDFF